MNPRRRRLIAGAAICLGGATLVVMLLYSRELRVRWFLWSLARDESKFLEYAASDDELEREAAGRFAATERGMQLVGELYLELVLGRLGLSAVPRPTRVYFLAFRDTYQRVDRAPGSQGYTVSRFSRVELRRAELLAPFLREIRGRSVVTPNVPGWTFKYIVPRPEILAH